MSSMIRAMTLSDKDSVMKMMQTFYASAAVLSNGSEEIFSDDIDQCLAGSPYLEGYIFEDAEEIQGYAMIAKSFSTEFGKPCIWIEDLYVKAAYRGCGIGGMFFQFIQKKYVGAVFRLEVEPENEGAIQLYKKNGFVILPYMEMKK